MISKSFLWITCILVLISCSATQKSAQPAATDLPKAPPPITAQIPLPKPSIKNSSTDTIPPPAFKIDTLISLSSGACVGHCPVYTYTILNDGSVSWYGQNYTDRLGNYIAKLPHDKIEVLQQWLSEHTSELHTEYPKYIEFVPDFPLTRIFIKNNQMVKSIIVNHSPPQELKSILAKVDTWLEQSNWKAISN